MAFSRHHGDAPKYKQHRDFSLVDLEYLCKSTLLDPEAGPAELQNKVQFDIRYYFAR